MPVSGTPHPLDRMIQAQGAGLNKMATINEFPHSPPDWNNLSVLQKNTLPPRSGFFVYSSEENALSRDIAKSKTISLSGNWRFNLSRNPFQAPQGFQNPNYDVSYWSDIKVPGMWQLQGYGKGPWYTNVNYPFPVDPPNVPFDENETGSYVRTFSLPDTFKDHELRLRFEGVDSSFHVWVNGEAVGYSQGSRNPSEFDITSHVKTQGENILAVRVYQWCDGSYIEDQVSEIILDPEYANLTSIPNYSSSIVTGPMVV